MRQIKGPSRSRLSIRPRALRASLTRHYEKSLQEDLPALEPPTEGHTAAQEAN